MVSGYDKNEPPEGRYEPEIGYGGKWLIICFSAVMAFASFGWLFF